jgi:triacylglycerol lipase
MPPVRTAPLRKVRLPVVYVPGFFSTFAYGWYFERSFSRSGYGFQQVAFPRLATGDMTEMASALRTVVEAAAGEFGRVNLVCHSAGGLIARYYLQKLSRGAAISSVVFLGTPHQGTLASIPALGVRACRQMIPGSGFMSELGEGGLGRILTNRSLSIYSRHDLLLLPLDGGRLPGARNVLLKSPLGHALPLDPRAYAHALAFIEEMAPA